MCTVTFIPSGDRFFFTSSRDEHRERPAALVPALYKVNGRQLLFPKDPKGGGSWIAVSESGNTGVLLNGAFEAHVPEPRYRKSRGLILIDLISMQSPIEMFGKMNQHHIEPFTIILFENKKLWRCVWDGSEKHTEQLSIREPHIWSSVTLYNKPAIQKRDGWFNKWIQENPDPSIDDIILFHQQGGDGDPFNDLMMKRDSGLFTNSISSVVLSKESALFRYTDLRIGERSSHSLRFQKTIPVKA
jgi:hypothetical protein